MPLCHAESNWKSIPPTTYVHTDVGVVVHAGVMVRAVPVFAVMRRRWIWVPAGSYAMTYRSTSPPPVVRNAAVESVRVVDVALVTVPVVVPEGTPSLDVSHMRKTWPSYPPTYT